ncbi:peptide ABC transporter substrate-binding protein [Symbiobacterium thermophilum]|uniref:ABC transporter substrate-binding protein n=1 Tax=Symbiobacterium thermophilum TaxID=2734 RepID=A0A953ID46_SYMTR|nr:peptide ABC transporter substrate-binding protein [Symbiobacterium thermophilum]MBY6277149.1 ABC transporter substrate-binding protein [Symbiobacterium thermophilum]
MRRFVAGMLAVLMLAAVGCSGRSSSGSQEMVIRMNIGTNPPSLDPRVTTGLPEAHVEIALFEGLMRLDEKGNAIPGAAARYEVNDDATVFTFYLRDGLKWSNGDPLTAEDFVWTWKSVLDPLLASEYAYQLYYIKGAEEMNTFTSDPKWENASDEEIKAEFERLAQNFGAVALDDKTLRVTLEAPTPYFLSLTAFHVYYPVHRASVEANPEAWFRNPDTLVGNGPFRLVSWTDKDKVIVEKNPNYWGANEVKLDKIEFYLIEEESTATTMFENGELDIIESGVNTAELDRLKEQYPNELKILPDLGIYYYLFNVEKEPLNDKRVRQALALAIDRNAIVTQITKGGQVPAYALVPEGIPEGNGDFRLNGGDFFQEDVEKARQLLAEAGYPNGQGFPTLTILYNTSEGHQRIAEAIQEMWKNNLGINVQLTNQEWGVYLDSRSTGDYEIARAGWIGDYIDPMTFIDMFVTGGGNNDTNWGNAQYDALVNTAKKSADAAERYKAMHEAEAILMDEMPIMPIYFYTRVIMVSEDVEGWSMPLTSPLNLRDASIKK